MGRSKEVDAWFARYDNPMKEVVERIRMIVLGADRRIDECIKWQAPTFTYRGNLASFFPKSKKHASLMFHSGAKKQWSPRKRASAKRSVLENARRPNNKRFPTQCATRM